jgi:nitrogen regulatory protein PII-like uncharacterized protein
MGLFGKSSRDKEIEREIKFKQGMRKVQNYVQKCRQSQQKFWDMGKRALSLGDRQQFESLARAHIKTGDIANRWERYMVSMETVRIQRDQVTATKEFAQSVNIMSSTMMKGMNPKELHKMQKDLEIGLAKAETLDEALSIVMDTTSDSVLSTDGYADNSIKEIEAAMTGETAHEEDEAFDVRIADGLKKIEEEMGKDIK